MTTPDYAPVPDRRRDRQTAARTPAPDGDLGALQRSAGNQAVAALIQAKLQVGAVDDPLEREADRVAKRVVSGAHRHDGPICGACGPVSGHVDVSTVRRSDTGGAGRHGGDLDPGTDTAIRQASGGRPLDAEVQRSMEAGFGVDFSGVQVHVDARADALNRDLGARAFTTGSDIFFRQGEYAPSSPGGQELLAHELTHVVQQGAASSAPAEAVNRSADPRTVQRKAWRIGKTGERLEVSSSVAEADRNKLLTEAEEIITELKATYGVAVSSRTTIKAIKNDYDDVEQSVLDSLRTRAWRIKELRALRRALGYYGAILGAKRSTSNRKDDDQEVTSVGKVTQAIDENTPAGELDTETLGEYFASKKNMGLFKSSENFTGDFTDLGDQLTGTFVHEIAHGLLSYAIPDYIAATGYWQDEDDELPVPQRTELPVTNYGKTNASEDLCESAMMYFVAPNRLKNACPLRYAFMVKLGTDWVPPPAQAPQIAPEAKGVEPPTTTSAPETVPPELEKAKQEIEKILQKVESQTEETDESAPVPGPAPAPTEAPTTVPELVGKPN